MSDTTRLHGPHRWRPHDHHATVPHRVPSERPTRHDRMAGDNILVTRVYRRGFRPPVDFATRGPHLARPVAIVTTSGFGLRAGARFAWYPVSDILLVTPGPSALAPARIDFLSGDRADLRVERQWLFNRRLREAVQRFELDRDDRAVGYEWGLGETVSLLARAEVAASPEELRHQARVEELRQQRRLMLARNR